MVHTIKTTLEAEMFSKKVPVKLKKKREENHEYFKFLIRDCSLSEYSTHLFQEVVP